MAPSLAAAAAHRAGARRRLGYLLLLPSLLIFGVFVFYPFVKNFYLGFYRTPAVPRAARAATSGFDQYRDVLTSQDFLDSLKTTVAVRAPHRARPASRSASGSRCSRTSSCEGIGDLPHDLLVDGRDVGRGRVGDLRHAVEPAGRAAAVARAQPPTRRSSQNPDVGARRRSRSSRSGRPSGSRSSSCRRGCRASPTTCSRRREVDGAGAWSRFWHVTLPMLSPTIFFAVVVGSIFAFQTFGQIDLLTQGGPLKKTNVLTYFIYDDAAAAERSGQGRGARGRAVRRSRWCSRWCSSGSSSGGCTMSVEVDADVGCDRRAPDRGRRSARYALLTVLAVIVLFPIYITVVNSLLTPDEIARAAADALPDRPAVEQLRATRGTPGTWARTC